MQKGAEAPLTAHRSGGGFDGRGCRFRRGAQNWLPYCRTIAAARLEPNADDAALIDKAHSAAMRLTTSSGSISAPFSHHLQTPARLRSRVLNVH